MGWRKEGTAGRAGLLGQRAMADLPGAPQGCSVEKAELHEQHGVFLRL